MDAQLCARLEEQRKYPGQDECEKFAWGLSNGLGKFRVRPVRNQRDLSRVPRRLQRRSEAGCRGTAVAAWDLTPEALFAGRIVLWLCVGIMATYGRVYVMVD